MDALFGIRLGDVSEVPKIFFFFFSEAELKESFLLYISDKKKTQSVNDITSQLNCHSG
jgi:hypothetical protein